MKNFLKANQRILAALLLISLVIYVPLVRSQQTVSNATSVQATPPLYPTQQFATATGAANTGVTATLTPGANQRVAVTYIYIVEVANGAITGAAGPNPIFTSTGLSTNLIWWGDNSTQGTGWQKVVADEQLGQQPIITAAGTAFAIGVNSTGQSTQTVRITIGGFFY